MQHLYLLVNLEVTKKGTNLSGNMFMGCFISFLADLDLDWAVWALQGNYYTRNGVPGMDEPFGMFNYTWNSLRSPEYHAKLQLIQQKLQGKSSLTNLILYFNLIC